MRSETLNLTSRDPAVAISASEHLRQHQLSIWKRTDSLLAGLLAFEWIGVMIVAVWRSPLTWVGAVSHIHPHLFAAVFLGSTIISLPVYLAFFKPGSTLTRHTIAVAQMLMSALLIHIGDGRIEMHFHIFGSLAFLAFYRDWRVIVTATVVTTLDHFLRGIFLPQSIFGVLTSSMWRPVEHALWVIFEDIFLIGACVQGVRELRDIAETQSLLEHSYHEVEQKVRERTAELENVQDNLMKAARSAGMAEIATSVLHNVGNVLNSVNVSATIVANSLRQSEVPSLSKVTQLLIEHKPDLGSYITQDQRGKLIPGFLTDLATCLNQEQSAMLAEVTSLSKGIDHIKEIVAAQQSMAKTSNIQSAVNPTSILESALTMQGSPLSKDVEIKRNYADCPLAILDQHKVLQILINLIRNAHQAVMVRPPGARQITLSVQLFGDTLRYQVVDNGMGIAPEHLNRIFGHGFTTKAEGHGFGLHSAANSSREMGGSINVISPGRDRGATFTLSIPFKPATEEAKCKM